MSWNEYWRAEMQGIEQTEEEHDSLWKEALLVIFLWERRLRRKIALRAVSVDLKNRTAVMRFRAFVQREVELFTAGLSRDLVGRATAGALDPAGGAGAVRGAQGRAIRRIPAIEAEARRSARKVLERDITDALDKRKVPAVLGPENEPVVKRSVKRLTKADLDAPGGLDRVLEAAEKGSQLEFELRRLKELREREAAELARVKGLAKEAARRKREREDTEDVLLEADDNPIRNIRYESARVTEQIIGLSGRNTRPGSAKDVIAYMLGTDDARTNRQSQGWRLNRGRMRLSIAAHVRAIHRRRTVSEADAAGIRLFRLDVPKRRLGKIAPGGLLGKHLWKVRTLGEWLEVHAKVNAGRVASSTFDGLGLGFGDVAYVVPVPVFYEQAARKQGDGFRERWLTPLRGKQIVRAA